MLTGFYNESEFDGEFANDYSWKEIEVDVVGKVSAIRRRLRLELKFQTCEPRQMPGSLSVAPFMKRTKKHEDGIIPLLAVPVWYDPMGTGDHDPALHSVYAESYNVNTREFSCINSWGTLQSYPRIKDTEVTRVDLIQAVVKINNPVSTNTRVPAKDPFLHFDIFNHQKNTTPPPITKQHYFFYNIVATLGSILDSQLS